MTGGRLLLTLLALTSTLTLPACTHDPPPPTPTTTTTTTSASPTTTSPTPDPPTKPASQKTPEGAITFVRYFWAAYNYAYATGDPSALESVSESRCKYCASSIKDVKAIKDARTRIEGYQASVIEAASPPTTITTGAVVVAAVKQAAGKAIYSDGQSTLLKAKPSSRFTFALAWSSSAWVVEGIDYAPTSS